MATAPATGITNCNGQLCAQTSEPDMRGRVYWLGTLRLEASTLGWSRPSGPHGRARTWNAGDVDAGALAVGELRQAGVHDVAARQRADARVQRLPLRPVAKQQDVRSAGEVRSQAPHLLAGRRRRQASPVPELPPVDARVADQVWRTVQSLAQGAGC